MTFIRNIISSITTNNQPQLLGRWRCVGTQKNGKDINVSKYSPIYSSDTAQRLLGLTYFKFLEDPVKIHCLKFRVIPTSAKREISQIKYFLIISLLLIFSVDKSFKN